MKQVLDFIKTHTVALACAAVALLAMIALFVYPIPAWVADLQAQVDARKATDDKLAALTSEQRTLPALDPKATEPQPLAVFPTQAVITAGSDAVKLLRGQSQNVLNEAVRVNQKPLLVPDALPRPQSLARQNFFDAYRAVTTQSGEAAQNGIIRTVLKGTLPPTSDELTAITQARTREIVNTRLQRNAAGQPTNQPQVDAEVAAMTAKLPLEQRLSRAQTSQIYVSPDAVGVQPELRTKQTSNEINEVDIFNAQFSLWLQTTLFQAIADANAGAKNVLDAPVKHLVRLSVPLNVVDANAANAARAGFGAPAEEGAAAVPVELKPDASVALTPNYAASPLGYASNSMFDPIRCEMVLRVDYRRLPEVLAKISRDHFVKIRNVSYRTVPSGIALSQGFLYDADGRTPLVEVTLDCEVLMLREWVARFMPDSVKRYFSERSSPAVAAG